MLSFFLYPAPQPSYSAGAFPDELVWIPCDLGGEGAGSDCDCVPAIVLQCSGARYMVLYLHSNGEDVGLCYKFACDLRKILEVHVMLVEYPGYGVFPGQCSEESLWRVVVAAFRFVSDVIRWPAEDIIIMGRSLGAALATRLAGAFTCHGLILVAPFLSLVDAVSQYVGVLARVLVKDRFSNRTHIKNVHVPTLVIHGIQDTLVPMRQGRELYELCPHDKKLFVYPDSMTHNSDLLSDPDFLIRPMLRFFALPDYSFVDFGVPAWAFDKRQCLKFHRIIEMAKDDAPLGQPLGDQEPFPTSPTMTGPQGWFRSTPASRGDVDDMDWAGDWTVRTPRDRVSGPFFSEGFLESDSTTATPVQSQDESQSGCSWLRPWDGPSTPGQSQDESQSVSSALRFSDAASASSARGSGENCLLRFESGATRSLTTPSTVPALFFGTGLNIDDGISRFLQEESDIETMA